MNSFAQLHQDKQIRLFSRQIKFTGKLEEDNSVALLFICEKQQKLFETFF